MHIICISIYDGYIEHCCNHLYINYAVMCICSWLYIPSLTLKVKTTK